MALPRTLGSGAGRPPGAGRRFCTSAGALEPGLGPLRGDEEPGKRLRTRRFRTVSSPADREPEPASSPGSTAR